MPESKREQHSLSPHSLLKSAFFGESFSKAYRAIHYQFGINIVEQSRKNLLGLIEQLKITKKDLLPEDKDSGTDLLTAKEWKLDQVWRERLFPLMTLRHGASAVEFDTLSPINVRQQEKKAVNTIHTHGQDAARHSNYFVVGFENHPTPLFLGSAVDIIEVALGELAASPEAEDLHGLFISGHFNQYSQSAHLAPVQYGTTRRHIEFDGQTMTKTYYYSPENGESFKRTVHYRDEVFAADRNVSTLSDALFYQFVLELRRLGNKFYQDLLNDLDNLQKIIATFHILFESCVYPEAKLPRNLDLNKPYVRIIRDTDGAKALRSRWFKAAKEFDVEQLKKCLEEAGELKLALNNTIDDAHRTALAVAIEQHTYLEEESTKREGTIQFLLQQVNPTINDILGHDAACHAVSAGDQQTLELLFDGISHHQNPLIQYHCYLNMEQSLLFAIRRDKQDFIDFLLKKVIRFTPTCAVIAGIYERFPRRSAELAISCLAKGADINVSSREHGMNALHLAAKAGDEKAVAFILEKRADINAKVSCSQPRRRTYKNQTALHLAAVNGQCAVVSQLIEAKADIDSEDLQGNTAYFAVVEKLARGLKSYEEEINEGKIFKKKVSKEEWEKHAAELKSVQNVLASHHCCIVREETLAQRCKIRKLHAVGVLSGTKNDKPCVVLCRRKDSRTQQATGYYLFPGGTFDEKEDASLRDTLAREIAEETGFRIDPDHHAVNLVHSFVHIENTGEDACYVQTDFYSIQLGEEIDFIKFVANDDLAEVRVVALDQLKPRVFDEKSSGYFYRGVRVQQSNALLLEDIILHKKVRDPKLVSETIILENYSRKEVTTVLLDNDVTTLQQYYYRGLELEPHIMRVCLLSSFELLEFIMGYGFSINRVESLQDLIGILASRWFLLLQGITPLMAATVCGHEELVYKLVKDYGADINLAVSGYTPISFACYYNHDKLVEFFLKRGNADSNVLGVALQAAIMTNEDTRCIQLLLDTGKIDFDGFYKVGLAELSHIGYALEKGNIKIIECLFNYGIQQGCVFNFNYREDDTVVRSFEGRMGLTRMYAELGEYPSYMGNGPDQIKHFEENKEEYWRAHKVVEWLIPFLNKHRKNFNVSDEQIQQLEELLSEAPNPAAPRLNMRRRV